MLTLRQLEYLVTIADTGSFALAARVANVSQPTLSQQVRTLEERLGARLLERSATGAILTPIGRSIVATARRMLSDASDIVALAAGSSDSLTGTLKLGTTPTLGPYLLSPIIADAPNEVRLRDVIQALIAHPELRAQAGAANQARVRAEFDQAQMVTRYKTLYEQVLGRPGALGGVRDGPVPLIPLA